MLTRLCGCHSDMTSTDRPALRRLHAELARDVVRLPFVYAAKLVRSSTTITTITTTSTITTAEADSAGTVPASPTTRGRRSRVLR